MNPRGEAVSRGIAFLILLIAAPSWAQHRLDYTTPKGKTVCYEYWNVLWDGYYESCMATPTVSQRPRYQECNDEATTKFYAASVSSREKGENIREVPCAQPAPQPAPAPNVTPPAPKVVVEKTLACVATATEKAESCKNSANQQAATTCNPANDPGLQRTQSEGDRLSTELSQTANYQQVCNANSGYNNDLAQAYGNFDQSCQQALTACRSSCEDARRAISACSGASLNGLNGEVGGALAKCSPSGEFAQTAQEARTQSQNSTANRNIANHCAQNSAAGGGNGPSAQKATPPAAAVSPTTKAGGGCTGSEPGCLTDAASSVVSRDPTNSRTDEPFKANVRASDLRKNAATNGEGISGAQAPFTSAPLVENVDRTPAPELPAVPTFGESTAGTARASAYGVGSAGSYGGFRATRTPTRSRSDEDDEASRNKKRQPATSAEADPDLRQFLPKTGGDKDGYLGIAGLNSPNKNLFEVVADRYQAVAASLFQE